MKLIIIFIVSLLSACGLIQDRSNEYSKAAIGKPLVIPKPYSDSKIISRYPIPDVKNSQPLAKDFEIPKPPNATAALKKEPYSIETVGNQTWLRLDMSPGKIWPLLDFFWSEHSVEVNNELITQGYMKTKPYQQANSKNLLHDALLQDASSSFNLEGLSFQLKLTQGVRRSTSELQLRIADTKKGEGLDTANSWPITNENKELEHALLSLMGKFITSDALQNRYSLLANDIGGESKIHLMKDKDGETIIRLQLSFQRAWNELGKALKTSGVLESDVDLSERSYYVSYLDKDSITSWYRSSESITKKSQERNFSLTISKGDEGFMDIRVKQLNPSLDAKLKAELLNIVFEHIS